MLLCTVVPSDEGQSHDNKSGGTCGMACAAIAVKPATVPRMSLRASTAPSDEGQTVPRQQVAVLSRASAVSFNFSRTVQHALLSVQMVWWGIGGNVTPIACRLAKRPGLGGVQDYQRVKFTAAAGMSVRPTPHVRTARSLRGLWHARHVKYQNRREPPSFLLCLGPPKDLYSECFACQFEKPADREVPQGGSKWRAQGPTRHNQLHLFTRREGGSVLACAEGGVL